MRSLDYISGTDLKLIQESSHFKMTSDSRHLGNFMKIGFADRVLDVGCNNGVLTLMAALKTKNTCIGIDINAEAIIVANENKHFNTVENALFEAVSFQSYQIDKLFDVIVCNPPYFRSLKNEQDAANFDINLKLEDLAQHAYRCLKDKGSCQIIFRANRMMECVEVFRQQRFELKRLQCIHHRPDSEASSDCMEFIKEGKPHLRIEAPIIQLRGTD